MDNQRKQNTISQSDLKNKKKLRTGFLEENYSIPD